MREINNSPIELGFLFLSLMFVWLIF